MKTSIPILVGTAMLVTLPALAQGPGGFGPGFGPGMRGGAGPGFGPRAGCVMEALDLDESQQTAWESIQDTLHETMQGLAQQRRDTFRELRDALAAPNPDAAAVGRLTIAEHELGDKMRAARDKARSDFAAVLRPDQQEKFEQMAEMRQACGQQRGMGGRAGGRGPHGPGPGYRPDCPFGSGGPDAPPAD